MKLTKRTTIYDITDKGESKLEDARWHTLTVAEVTQRLGTSVESGLSSDEAERRLESCGPNELEEKASRGLLVVFLSQFSDFMIWVLIAAALVSFVLLHERIDALAIVAILLLNAILGTTQEMRAERSLAALKKLASPNARVIRDGKEEPIAASRLVAGDLVLLEAGDIIPADGRVVSCFSFKTQEASLTGESESEAKDPEEVLEETTSLGDRVNMVYSATTVASGRARALVTATASLTEVGKIAEAIQVEKEKTPLQLELKRVGKRIALLCLFVCAFVFLAGILTGKAASLMFLASVSLAVAAIPEGLPAATTVALALGVQKMAKRRAIVRKLHAVETLGSTGVILTDKTGTLTHNQMVAKTVSVPGLEIDLTNANDKKSPTEALKQALHHNGVGQEELRHLFRIAGLCNDVRRGKEEKLIGDPTEQALYLVAEQAGFRKGAEEKTTPRLMEVPFDAKRKAMTTIHQLQDQSYEVLTKGAPEVVLGLCRFVQKEGRTIELSEPERTSLLAKNNELANKGLRVMAFAFKETDTLPGEQALHHNGMGQAPAEIEKDLVFVGFIGLFDPPRQEVAAAIEACKKAQIVPVMVTGDQKLTAVAVAQEIGLLDGKKVLTDQELEAMSDEELADIIEDVAACVRVDPIHKTEIAKAFKAKGYIIAMTGDGINDAPALKMADIGISMGVVGTDVAKEASDMVLADDNFATIVTAIEQGRLIFDNIKKFIFFLLSCNVSEVATMFLIMLAGIFPIPLLPVQILWINLVTDGLPALALGVDPPSGNLMERSPRDPKEAILSNQRLKTVAWQGLVLTVGAVASYLSAFYLLGVTFKAPATAQTMVFTTLVLVQLLHTLNFRSSHSSVFSKNSLANKYLLAAILGSIFLQLIIIYLPALQSIFHTTSLGLREWAVVWVCSFVPVALIDALRKKEVV